MTSHHRAGASRVAVVGAGVAGLRAAAVLERAGLAVTVLERSARVGGRVASDVVDGHVVDHGFQVLNPGYPALRRAIDVERLDLRPFTAGLALRTDDGLRRWGHPLKAPRLTLGTLGALGRNPGDALALARWLRPVLVAGPAAHRLARRVEAADDVTLGRALDDAGVAGELREALLGFLSGVVLDHPAEVANRYALLVVRSFLSGVPGLPVGGIGVLPRLLAEGLDVRLDHEVETIERDADGALLRSPAGDVRADVIVWATDAAAAHDRLDLAAPEPRGVVTQWWSAPTAPAADSLVHVDVRAGRGPLVNTAVVSQAVPEHAPAGRHLVQGSALLGSGPVPSEAEMRRHAGEIHGVDPGDWEPVARHEIVHALPATTVPARVRAEATWLADDLVVCGDHRATPSLQGALASGERAATAVLDRLGLPRDAGGRRAS
ncbi:FAD-dependent oxidoreductase [Nocardioides sp. TRM66260-LWL]|uniref:FAD-dependent oxidoreductase n=1 Tax=Nocardioides sp. TRM66260-LWL TaxID=2874478 RepID=UPI001CC39C04|nr:FAD-dependent oxidoreductase [Nocardioides sp. TRM66260-LWL]MBZ5732965.1 FAD-dependent oxidoreductase [Nocardioides sp. TRM66260-LWL]